MSTYLDNGFGHVAWNGDEFKSNDKERDKYFEKDKKGQYVLKDGYESRYLGSGNKVSRQGAVSTYTNAYDDLHDDYDPNNDRKNYGIYKIQQPKTQTIVKQAPAPKPKPKPVEKKMEAGSFKVSPEIQQAKERVRTYENDIMSGKTSEDIYKSNKYELDLNKGAAGIGAPSNFADNKSAQKATDSFLNEKVFKAKKQLGQFSQA